ncbi:hypothetical protein [Streptomyces sp. NPDC006739]|uniref:hypothetical protein n=1 Tax=Streptomyces sp. NPDC006739 TaxID=3364763 RepID=UPI0036A2D2A5
MVLDDRADRLQKDVRLRMNQGRHRFRMRFADLPEGAVDGVEQAVSERGLIVVEVGPEKALFQTLRGLAFPGQASDRLFHATIRNFSYSAWTSRGGR